MYLCVKIASIWIKKKSKKEKILGMSPPPFGKILNFEISKNAWIYLYFWQYIKWLSDSYEWGKYRFPRFQIDLSHIWDSKNFNLSFPDSWISLPPKTKIILWPLRCDIFLSKISFTPQRHTFLHWIQEYPIVN